MSTILFPIGATVMLLDSSPAFVAVAENPVGVVVPLPGKPAEIRAVKFSGFGEPFAVNVADLIEIPAPVESPAVKSAKVPATSGAPVEKKSVDIGAEFDKAFADIFSTDRPAALKITKTVEPLPLVIRVKPIPCDGLRLGRFVQRIIDIYGMQDATTVYDYAKGNIFIISRADKAKAREMGLLPSK